MKEPHEIRSVIRQKGEEAIDKLFADVHKELGTKSGDISPEQTILLNKIKDNLFNLILEHVEDNL